MLARFFSVGLCNRTLPQSMYQSNKTNFNALIRRTASKVLGSGAGYGHVLT